MIKQQTAQLYNTVRPKPTKPKALYTKPSNCDAAMTGKIKPVTQTESCKKIKLKSERLALTRCTLSEYYEAILVKLGKKIFLTHNLIVTLIQVVLLPH